MQTVGLETQPRATRSFDLRIALPTKNTSLSRIFALNKSVYRSAHLAQRFEAHNQIFDKLST